MSHPWRTVYSSSRKRVLVKPGKKPHLPARPPARTYAPPPPRPYPACTPPADESWKVLIGVLQAAAAVAAFLFVMKFLAAYGTWIIIGLICCKLTATRR